MGRGEPTAHLVVGVLRLELRLPENHSLKGKRSVLRTIKSRVSNTFNVSVAECAAHDLWQRAVLGVARVGAEQRDVEGALHQVVGFIQDLHLVEVGEQQVEYLHY
jgi:hypothetical protein